MGTNYYAVRNKPTIYAPYHIGKSSIGWRFLFHSVNELHADIPVEWNTYEQVKDWLYKHTVENMDFVIMNEYDEIVSFEDLFKLIDRKQKYSHNVNDFTFARNVNGYRFYDDDFS